MGMRLGLLGLLLGCSVAVADDPVEKLSEHLPKTAALVVAVCESGEAGLPAVARLVDTTPWILFCRSSTPGGLAPIRNWAREKGLLGKRVYVADGEGGPDRPRSLWLADDLADAVWVAPGVRDRERPTKAEILRVLHAGGVGVVGAEVLVKPEPEGVDAWRHPYHGPDNNVVSRDLVARLPGELRFQTYPVFAPMPDQALFAGGRIFFFSGHIAFHEREEPLLNTLTVLNAYNGLRVWSRRLDPNHVVHNVSKFATASEVVFSEGETLWILDAATGKERGKFTAPPEAAAAGDTDWKWVVQQNDTLWAALGPPDAHVAPHRQKGKMGHWPWGVANEHYQSIVDNFGAARTLAAFRYPEMTLLWSQREADPFDARALCMEGGRLFQLAAGKYIAARDAATGKPLWRRTPETSAELFDAVGSSLRRQGWGLGWATYCSARAHDGVVCIAGPSLKKTIGVDFQTGDLLWASDLSSPHPFFVDDALFVVPRVARPAAACRVVEPRTGDLLEQFSLGVIGSCTRLTVTPNQFFYRPGGGEGRTVYVELDSRKLADYEGVVRPGCFDGVVPANGRLYWTPLACDCWQVHGTFSMAPRSPVGKRAVAVESPAWAAPANQERATASDWPMFRSDPAGTATVAASVGKKARELWMRRLPGGGLTAPVCVGRRIFLGGTDGTVRSLDATSGKTLWKAASHAAVLFPPTYWNGRVLFGSCDGLLYCVDASSGQMLGRTQIAPQKRFVNIMDRFMSAWPLAGGVLVSNDGIAYTAAGSTAADGTIAAAIDPATGTVRWREAYTLDRDEPPLSFGVQGNLLLKNETLYINGGAPVGMIALDAETGKNARVVAKLEAGMETFLEPGDKPIAGGRELHSEAHARTTIFKQHQGRVYFPLSGRHVALIDGRLFCSRDLEPLDRIVDLMNLDPKTGKKLGGNTTPQDVMRVPIDEPILWAGNTADIRGLAVGTDGLVVLHENSAEAIAPDGRSLWSIPLPATPVRWGIALAAEHCVVTLADGLIVCLAKH